VFEGRKTGIFWWGLIFVALSVCVLFATLWSNLVLNTYSVDWRYLMPYIFGGVVFLLVGLYMMKSGVKKEDKPS
jgi:putative Mn2+ efflux pump MntP